MKILKRLNLVKIPVLLTLVSLLFVLPLSLPLQADQDQPIKMKLKQNQNLKVKLLGNLQLLDLKDQRNTWGFSYYLKVQQNKGNFVIPVIFSKNTLKKNLGTYLNDSVIVTGTLQQRTVKVGENQHQISFLQGDQIQEIKLSALGVDKNQSSQMAQTALATGVVMVMTGTTPMVGLNMKIPDQVANTLIFTAGAALIGKILFK